MSLMDGLRPKIQLELAYPAPHGVKPQLGAEREPNHPRRRAKLKTRQGWNLREYRLHLLNRPNRRIRTRTYGGVTGKAREGLPMSIL